MRPQPSPTAFRAVIHNQREETPSRRDSAHPPVDEGPSSQQRPRVGQPGRGGGQVGVGRGARQRSAAGVATGRLRQAERDTRPRPAQHTSRWRVGRQRWHGCACAGLCTQWSCIHHLVYMCRVVYSVSLHQSPGTSVMQWGICSTAAVRCSALGLLLRKFLQWRMLRPLPAYSQHTATAAVGCLLQHICWAHVSGRCVASCATHSRNCTATGKHLHPERIQQDN